MSYSIAAWPGGILSMLLVPCEKMNCGALLTSSCRVVWLYIKITNHSSTLSCLLDCINCGIDKSRITYYNNAVSSFKFLELHTQPSGDIHPQPGPIHNYQYQCELLNALIDRKTAIYHATIQHLLALFRKQCPLVAQA